MTDYSGVWRTIQHSDLYGDIVLTRVSDGSYCYTCGKDGRRYTASASEIRRCCTHVPNAMWWVRVWPKVLQVPEGL